MSLFLLISLISIAYGYWGTNGARYRRADTGEIFLFYDGECHHIPNPTTFNRLFKNWNTEPLEPIVMGSYGAECPQVYDIDSSAMLVKFEGSDKVYFYNRELRHIANIQTFDACNFDSGKIVVFHPNTRRFFKEGRDLQF